MLNTMSDLLVTAAALIHAHRRLLRLFFSAVSLLWLLGPIAVSAQSPLPERLVAATEIPNGLNTSDWQSIREQMTAHAYSATATDEGGYRAVNPASGLHIDYLPNGTTRLTPNAKDAWDFGLTVTHIGPNTLNPPEQLSSAAQTVTYHWNSTVREWWVNSETGLEQWLELSQRPLHLPINQPLTVQMTVSGSLHGVPTATGTAVAFTDETGATVFTYDKLNVWDATGKALSAQMNLKGQTLALVVDDAQAVYPLTIDPTITVQQQAYLKASNTGAEDRFGLSVAVSGDTVVVGAYFEDSNATGVNGNQSDNSATEAGAAYVFVRSGSTWSQQAYLKASNTGAGDWFGESVAVSGDTVVVGAYLEASNATGVNGNQSDDSASGAGAAYVFVRSGSTWSQQAYLKASNPGVSDYFGVSVAVSGDTLVVGAVWEDSNATGVNGNQSDNSATDAGAVYVFAPNIPIITLNPTSPTLSAFSTLQGTASAAQSFEVGGTNLTSNITVTAPSGFEVSLASGSGYSSSVNLTPTSGTVALTPVYVRLSAAATAGNYSGNISLTATGASSASVAVSGTVNLSTVTISATDASGSEAGLNTVTFRISRDSASTSALTVNYTVSGTASSSDYTPTLTGSATIDANATFVDITLTPVDDALVESSETVSLTLTADAAYTLGATTNASATIADNDVAAIPVVTISPATQNIAEGSNANITITRTDSTANSLTVNATVTLGTGTVVADYTLTGGSISGQSGSVMVTIPAGQASVTVNLAAVDDTTAEANNTVTFALVDGATYDLGAISSSTATIPANDFGVTTTNDSGDGSLRQAILNANAVSSDDTITFAASANGTITLTSILPGLENNGTLTITGNGATVTKIDANNSFRVFVIPNGTVTLSGMTITRGNGLGDVGGGIYNGGTLTIRNSIISNNSTTGSTGGGLFSAVGANLTVINSAFSGNVALSTGGAIFNTGNALIVNSTFSANTALGSVYTEGTTTINNSILANNTDGDCYGNGTSIITVQNSLIEDASCGIVNGVNGNRTGDPALNGDLTLSTASSAINAGNNSVIPNGVTTDLAGNARIQQSIVDMGAYESPFTPLPTVTISATDNGGSETGPDSVTFRISRNAASTSALTVKYTVSGTASSSDYTPTLTGSATIAASATSVDITLTPVDDSLVEGNETVTLTLSADAAYTLGTTTSASATIANKGNGIFQDDFEN